MDWTEELSVRCLLNGEYQEAMEELRRLEPDFAALRETLSPEQQELLDRYIAACEALEDELAKLAYRIGRERGV